MAEDCYCGQTQKHGVITGKTDGNHRQRNIAAIDDMFITYGDQGLSLLTEINGDYGMDK